MVTTTVKNQTIKQRLEKTVTILMEERPLFKAELNFAQIVEDLYNVVMRNLTINQFQELSDQELKENCSFVMSTKLISGLLDDLTPEEIAIFDSAIKRK